MADIVPASPRGLLETVPALRQVGLLAGVAAALLMLTDQLCTAGPARSAPAGGPAPADVSAAVARKVTEILAEMLP